MPDQPSPMPIPAPGPRPGPRPTPPPAADRVRILRKYARLFPNGSKKPVLCGSKFGPRKVIFDDQERAELAGAELAALEGGKPSRVYGCPRSRFGHFHLTTDLEGRPDAVA